MTGPARDKSCEDRIDAHLQGRLSDLRPLWAAYQSGEEDTGSLAEFGLCFDFVRPDTYPDQPEAYFRYQLSWGGPSDEFRFFVNLDFSCHRIEYVFLDWFDGACRPLSGEGADVLREIWDWFRETGAAASAYDRAAQ